MRKFYLSIFLAAIFLAVSANAQEKVSDAEPGAKNLATLKNEISELKAENMKNMIIFSSAALVLIAGVVFLSSKYFGLKGRINHIIVDKNKELEITNTKLRVSEFDLKELNATKDKFFSIIAHDLRNPLGAFKNVTEVMVEHYDDFDEAERKEFLFEMKKGALYLYELLENLLTWSRSQRSKIDFNPENLDIADIAKNSTSLLKMTADSKSVKLENNIEKGAIAYIDGNMITAVIRNLVSNAIKFTPEGGSVKIGAERDKDGLTVSVVDNGVGISEEDRRKLFQIGVHHTTRGTAKEKGTGLGLILCKEFVEKNGGKIWVESSPGEGSSFYFTLPPEK